MRNPAPSPRSQRRIIIADDESLIRLDLREMLISLEYDVIAEVGDGRTAVDLAKKLRPDLVIMDIKMPEVDGIAAAEVLTREKIAPVVLLTAYSDQVLVERAKEAGVVGYVVKPFREAVERAKGILMEVHGLRETEAFHRIRRTSMDSRKSMKEVAEAILLTHEMEFGPSRSTQREE